MHNINTILVDGMWGSWGSYGTCSISCTASGSTATGTYTRTRSCDDPAPKYDGKQCVGSGSQSSSCTSSTYCPSKYLFDWFIVLNATFSNISAISWLSVLVVEEAGVSGENHRPVASHWQTLSYNVVHLALIEIRTHNISVIGTMAPV